MRGRHAAREIDDPEAMVATILPDGGRAYLSKIFNDAWMSQYGFLERTGDRTVGDVLFAKTAAGEIPPFVTVQTHQKVKDAISLLHEHRVSQLPVVSASDKASVVGSIGERGLLKHAVGNPAVLSDEIKGIALAVVPRLLLGPPSRLADPLRVVQIGVVFQPVRVHKAPRSSDSITRSDEYGPALPVVQSGQPSAGDDGAPLPAPDLPSVRLKPRTRR